MAPITTGFRKYQFADWRRKARHCLYDGGGAVVVRLELFFISSEWKICFIFQESMSNLFYSPFFHFLPGLSALVTSGAGFFIFRYLFFASCDMRRT